jgi:hypothetical protein
MTREEWARSLPDPIHPAQVVERINAALEDVGRQAEDILTSVKVDTPLSLANAQRDAIKLRDGAQQFAQFQPTASWALSSAEGQAGMKVGLALFDGLDDLRRAAMGKPAPDRPFDPVDAAQRVARGAERMAAGAREAANAAPTLAMIAGILWLAHKFGDDL